MNSKKKISRHCADTKDWRARLEQLTVHSANVANAMASSQSQLQRLSADVEKSLERVQTRENYMNTQLQPLLGQYSKTREQLAKLEEQYRSASGRSFFFANHFCQQQKKNTNNRFFGNEFATQSAWRSAR